MIFRERVIETKLTIGGVIGRLMDTDKFECCIKKEKFEIREKAFMSNRIFFPLIVGTFDLHKDQAKVFLSFIISKLDKIFLLSFFAFNLSLSVFLYFLSQDILISFVVIIWSFLLLFIFMITYYRNCRRAFKKIVNLLCEN
ncbi:MAG: hypothetical protein IKJ59_06315 [Clostridia bacterium]|nr:hypothetical protein [Clostridia bacterium]